MGAGRSALDDDELEVPEMPCDGALEQRVRDSGRGHASSRRRPCGAGSIAAMEDSE